MSMTIVAGIPAYSEVNWGVNPQDPSLLELLWVAGHCAAAVAANEPYNKAWDPQNKRLPFIYQCWMDMGGPSVAEIQKRESLPHTSPTNIALSLDPPAPQGPPLPTSQVPPTVPVAPKAPDVPSVPDVPIAPDVPITTNAPDVPDISQAPVTPYVPNNASDIPDNGPNAPEHSKVAKNLKGKGKVQPAGSNDDTQGQGNEREKGDKPGLQIHCHAPFTMEKQKTVLSMTYDFLDSLRAFAKEENLDPTAVVRVFQKHLGAAKLTSWQAYQRLLSLEHGGGGMYLPVLTLGVINDKFIA